MKVKQKQVSSLRYRFSKIMKIVHSVLIKVKWFTQPLVEPSPMHPDVLVVENVSYSPF